MKRIAIVSRTHSINYGANLQAAALQRCLQKEGVDACYVDFSVDIPTKGFRKILTWGYRVLRFFLGYPKRLKRTKAFRDRYVRFTKPITKAAELGSLEAEYDVFMSGSDQIWNPRYYENSKGLYLLTFVLDKPKVAYGSSFGVEKISNSYKEIVRQSLSQYTRLSVREKKAQELLADCGITADYVIDPTFLLTKDEWLSMCGQVQKQYTRKYICCYVMSGATELNRYILRQAEHLKNELGSDVDVLIIGEKEYKGLFSSCSYVRDAGPLEFLKIINGAQFVLTSSFHGTCFSIIFQKDFYSVLSKKNKFNSRIEDLLGSIQLSDRLRYKENAEETHWSAVDYSRVIPLLSRRIAESTDFIKAITKI